MSTKKDSKGYEKFKDLTFNDFKRLAQNNDLSKYEKIGFPDSYRKGYEPIILEDIVSKLSALSAQNKIILDIGCGCSELVYLMIDLCQRNNSKLLLVDSEEMLSILPNKPFVEKIAGRFPDCFFHLEKYKDLVDAILVYSVVQHVFLEINLFNFIDKACTLLKDGGEMLIGDVPNISKRKRFFSSRAGVECHQKFTGTNEYPKVDFMTIEEGKIDDGVVFGILQRYRSFGLDSYLLPQNEKMPISTRREDILIKKP